MMDLAKIPPHAPDLEQAVLGCCMITRDAVSQIDFLSHEAFYVPAHMNIFRAIQAIHGAGAEPHILNVTHWLRDQQILEACGGPAYISLLTNKVASTANLDYMGRIIAQKHILRSMIVAGNEVMRAAYNDDDCFDVMNIAETALDKCRGYLTPNTIGNAADEGQACADGTAPKFIRFNTPGLSEGVMFQHGLIHVFAGRTGMGKSILSTEEAWGWTQLGPVLMFSPEMNKRQVTARVLARESGVPYSLILSGEMTEQEQDSVAATWIRIGDRMKRLLIDPTSGITPAQVRSRIERVTRTHDVQAVVIDHLHKMRSGLSKIDGDSSSRARYAYCINELSEIAKTTQLPFMVMAQLNREVEDRPGKKPRMSDILWAGDIEHEAALVGLLFREGYYAENPPYDDTLEINIAKYRDGSVGIVKTPITPALSRIGTPPLRIAHPDNRTEVVF